ncbi:hypothetical protein BC833DRAFT_118895 [Globomyces pollinis-pini]|nr:hypothetical protein BC833DRAFT_118895 [Globomyces pollinis-pini]
MLVTLGFIISAVVANQCAKITYRKEINDLTEAEWEVYQSTILKATKIKNANGLSIWEQAASNHNQLHLEIHNNCRFFYWHRQFITDVERQLQAINPQFFFPYWDSPTVYNQVDQSKIWSKIGRNGSPIQGDMFKNAALYENGMYRPLTRDFTSLNGQLPSAQTYADVFQQSLANGGYSLWSDRMELWHGSLHIYVAGASGQMMTMSSPLDPMFYMHHVHLDLMFVQAQAGWKAANFGPNGQVGGLYNGNQKCSYDTKIPGYGNLKIGNIVEVRDMCVDYVLPGRKVPEVTTTVTTKTTIATTSTNPITSTSSTSTPSLTSTSATSVVTDAIITTTLVTGTQSAILATSTNILNSLSLYPTITIATITTTTTTTTTTEPTYVSSCTALPTSVPVQPLPQTYDDLKSCPPPLPDSWLRMMVGPNGNLTSLREKANRIHLDCQNLIKKIEKGVSPELPYFPIAQRPSITYNAKSDPITPVSPVTPKVVEQVKPVAPNVDSQNQSPSNYPIASNAFTQTPLFVIGLLTLLL